jgi:hypothetical protein
MNCTCPKCEADTPVELDLVTDTGTSTTCDDCKATFWLVKESFARRALRKPGKIYCVKCGTVQGPHIVCVGCGVKYPEYVGIQLAKPAARRRSKKMVLVPQQGSGGASSLADLTVSVASSKGLLKLVGAAAFIISLSVGGYFYHQHTLEQKFLKNYVLALFYVKSGIDVGFAKCAESSAAWKKSMDAGQNLVPTVTPLFQSDLANGRKDFEGVMVKMAQPPKKFASSREELLKLDSIYAKILPIASSPSGSLASYTESVNRLDGEYRTALKNFKANLPPQITKVLKDSKSKYKGLEDF